jgi:hypothetical protein
MIEKFIWRAALAGMLALAFSAPSQAEPYFAIMTGQKCAACHVNATGGGKRTDFGNAFAQQQLPARTPTTFWNGRVMEYLAIGGNMRGTASATTIDNTDDSFEFDLDEALLYLEVPVLPDRLTFYLDERLSPDASSREAFAMLHFRDKQAYVKVGKLFLPFGWRLEDDSEFIRQVSGINYNTSDNGVEGGLDVGPWSMQLAITNGSGGGGETNTGKQASAVASFVQSSWRIGASANYNDLDEDSRTLLGGFAGVKTGPVSWLGEIDHIDDDALGDSGREQWIGFLEANWWLHRGHNLKFTYGYFEPDDDVDEDERARYSIVYEYFPFAFMQLRAGVRSNDGIPQNDAQNADTYFFQLHAFF